MERAGGGGRASGVHSAIQIIHRGYLYSNNSKSKLTSSFLMQPMTTTARVDLGSVAQKCGKKSMNLHNFIARCGVNHKCRISFGQQLQPLLFSACLASSSSSSCIRPSCPFSPNFFILPQASLPISVKSSVMLVPSFALTQKYCISYDFANLSPESYCTLRFSLRSVLLPTRKTETSGLECSWICLIQFSTLLKEATLSTAKVRMIMSAPRQKVVERFLNFSCPAVSQICSLILYSSTCSVLTLKSTPMVDEQVGLKQLSQQRSKMLVFPTPLSPIITAFTTKSQSVFFFGFIQKLYYQKDKQRVLIHLNYPILTHLVFY